MATTSWLTTDQIADYLNVHKQTVRRLIREQGLPHHRTTMPNGRYRFDQAEVDEWFRTRRSTDAA